MKFLSHLDWQNTLVKGLFRSQLPVVFTEGFNPIPKISLGAALPIFVESETEFIDFELYGDKIFALVKPRSTRISSMVSQIKIAFNKHSGDINEIVVTEGSGSSTKYIFYNQIINQPIRNEIFTIN